MDVQPKNRRKEEMWDGRGMRNRGKNMNLTVELIVLPMGVAWK